MKRSRFSRRNKPDSVTEELLHLAGCVAESSSRIEDEFWERQLQAAVDKLLAESDDGSINAALDQLYSSGGRAYDELADLVESACQSRRLPPPADQDVILFAAPVLAWSRYSIPSGRLPETVLANLRVQLGAHVLASGAKLGLCDFLWSPDQLPQSYSATAQLCDRLTKAALHDRDTISFLSDTRYLIGAVAAPRQQALFRWQEGRTPRADVLAAWRDQGGEALRGFLPACALEMLLPQPYHAAARDADRASRPYSLRAAVSFLQTTLNVPAAGLRAVVAPFHDRQLEEYRVGFTLTDSSEVVHGVVWPLLEAEDEHADIPGQIESVLREAGLHQVLSLEHRFPLEYCDDCGAPLYPDPDGEPAHAELPEEPADAAPRHLH